MATKLEELEVTSVDFVDRGANPDAHITLFKRDSGGETVPENKENVWKKALTGIFKMAGFKQSEIDAALESIEKSDSAAAPDTETRSDPAGTEQPTVGQAVPQSTGITKNETKGEGKQMVDTSRMTPAEKAFYDDIVKRYSTGDTVIEKSGKNGSDDDGNMETREETRKSAEYLNPRHPIQEAVPGASAVNETRTEAQEDIYKGLHPAVAEELKMLRKRADEEDERRLTDVAKKYEIIGKKPEELVPLLKSLKAAGGTAYTDMISVLDASLDAVNRSGVFEEIGKSGSYSGGQSTGAWSRIEKKADEIMAANPNIGRYQAIDMACMQNPSLVHEYEDEM